MMRIWLALLGVLGCSGSKETESVNTMDKEAFLEDYPSRYCELQQTCAPERFRDLFNNDFNRCLEDEAAPVSDRIEAGDCNFDRELAAVCVETISDLDCDSWEADEDETCSAITLCGQ